MRTEVSKKTLRPPPVLWISGKLLLRYSCVLLSCSFAPVASLCVDTQVGQWVPPLLSFHWKIRKDPARCLGLWEWGKPFLTMMVLGAVELPQTLFWEMCLSWFIWWAQEPVEGSSWVLTGKSRQGKSGELVSLGSRSIGEELPAGSECLTPEVLWRKLTLYSFKVGLGATSLWSLLFTPGQRPLLDSVLPRHMMIIYLSILIHG